MSIMADLALKSIRSCGGGAGELGMFIWPHLTPDDRAGLIIDGAGDPWSIVESALELCPVEVAIPERLLNEFEEDAKEIEAQGDVWGMMALDAIKRYREGHARATAGAEAKTS
ncbi:hypothetical protein H8R18_01275 [Nanchangia anserum]|uniref:Uncharacterized protein n=1 Tax=Nanchangia anserum TaxID=2692125 RepID=A0A8I0GE60_9ACTO|nr:hypothetical protein [Nanchangia anserum]MBD3689868.1 hypothetical protein [Nanchangia anserum]QOX82036.1 hypothetical protein H8R18_01275 [Nanchangia anserum]